jgi:hypothetical protein
MSAPCSSSSWTQSMRPDSAAACSGFSNRLSTASILAPAWRRAEGSQDVPGNWGLFWMNHSTSPGVLVISYDFSKFHLEKEMFLFRTKSKPSVRVSTITTMTWHGSEHRSFQEKSPTNRSFLQQNFQNFAGAHSCSYQDSRMSVRVLAVWILPLPLAPKMNRSIRNQGFWLFWLLYHGIMWYI